MILLNQILGLADSKWNGIKGSVYACVGLDLHSTPGLTKVHQKLTKNSGSTVDALCRVKLAASNGYTFWFSYTSGKIWARAAAGTWTLAYTTAPGAGSAGCLGAYEWNGVIYWATQSRLHKIAIANADDAWASVTLDFGTFGITDSEFHPMALQDDTLWIGDGYRLSSVDSSGTFTANEFDIRTPNRIKCLIDFEDDLLFGVIIATTVNEAWIYRWDCISPGYTSRDKVDEVGVNAFIRDDNYVYAQCGRRGAFYYYNGSVLEPYTRIPGTFNNVQYGEVYPGSHAMFNGVPIFGFSNSPEAANTTGNPAMQGVYSLGSYSRNYPKVLDLSWVISEAVTSGIEIGAIAVVDFTLLVSWKNGSSYGVDAIDYTAKYASAYFETRFLWQEQRDLDKTMQEVEAFYNSLPASTGFTFSYNVNEAGYVAMTSVTDSIKARVYAALRVDQIGSLMVKCAFTVSGNNAPTMEAFGVTKDGEENAGS